jgi:hypothetical protein
MGEELALVALSYYCRRTRNFSLRSEDGPSVHSVELPVSDLMMKHYPLASSTHYCRRPRHLADKLPRTLSHCRLLWNFAKNLLFSFSLSQPLRLILFHLAKYLPLHRGLSSNTVRRIFLPCQCKTFQILDTRGAKRKKTNKLRRWKTCREDTKLSTKVGTISMCSFVFGRTAKLINNQFALLARTDLCKS